MLPVIHERLDLAAVTRALLDAVQPAAVAVELPVTLADVVRRAVKRLPRLSLVLSEEDGEDALVWLVSPGDPLVEALRWATEHERPTAFIDPDVRYSERHADPVPDPHALWTLGPSEYLRMLTQDATLRPVTNADRLREAGMAYHLQTLRRRLDEAKAEAEAPAGPIVALVGAAHVQRLRAALAGPTATPLARQHRRHVELHHVHPQSLTALMTDMPLGHAAYELLRSGSPPPVPDLSAAAAQPVSLHIHGLRLISGERDDSAQRRRRAVPEYAAHHSARTLQAADSADEAPVYGVDRQRLGLALWNVAASSYRTQTREELATWQRRTYFDFARRYARVQGLLLPGLYEWVVAGRGVADDNLAWEVFDAARCYPWQAETADDLGTVRIEDDMLNLGSRKVRFRRRFFRVKQRPIAVPVRQRPQTDDPADWLQAFDDLNTCSYPQEDLVIEDYARFLQRKAVGLLSAENEKSEPFATSLLDGIDLRATLRNVQDRRIYVRQLGRVPGAAGSVILIFDDDPDGERYPYLMTWHGEHEEESDMAFYATDPYQQIVGPGITRATYGGLMMTYPPDRVFDIWTDPEYGRANTKAEVLTLAAIDYSEEKLVVHVAAKPPAATMKHYAAQQNKRLLHIPLASLSPVTLKRLRVVHFLAGHDKRDLAGAYIW